MTAKHASLGDRLTKAIRVRGDAARQAYHVARRAGGLLRDRPRRTALRELPPTLFDIVKSDGFLVLPPGSFPETPAVVAEAHAALARFEAEKRAGPDSWKKFLVNVIDPSELTPASATVRFALRGDVIAAVSRYLGIVPRLGAISILHSDTVKTPPKSSQLHHCDGGRDASLFPSIEQLLRDWHSEHRELMTEARRRIHRRTALVRLLLGA